MVRVFHVQDHALTFDSKKVPNKNDILLVATIDGTMDEAFELTNHIDELWHRTDNPRVVFNAPPGFTAQDCGARSTSVGDIMEEFGEFYIVGNTGFRFLEGYDKPSDLFEGLSKAHDVEHDRIYAEKFSETLSEAMNRAMSKSK
jgi:hypothetical protein